eukprot:COSAG04_NODE_310_length_17225_cov_12.768014_8_plen_106_part_00
MSLFELFAEASSDTLLEPKRTLDLLLLLLLRCRPPAPEGSAPPRRRIVLIKRREGEARSVSNHAELEARLHFEFPEDDARTNTPNTCRRKRVATAESVRVCLEGR